MIACRFRFPEAFKVIYLVACGLVLLGCTDKWVYPQLWETAEPEGVSSTAVFFVPDPEDKEFFQTIGREQDKVLAECSEEQMCIRPHYLRGLTGLYESKELAVLHFQEVIVLEPDGQLAHDSRLWLWLLGGAQTADGKPEALDIIGKRLVRELVVREMRDFDGVAPQSLPSGEGVQEELDTQDDKINDLTVQMKELTRQIGVLKSQKESIRAVRKDLNARDKQVEELTRQLDALRRIDQELRKKALPTRPSDALLHK